MLELLFQARKYTMSAPSAQMDIGDGCQYPWAFETQPSDTNTQMIIRTLTYVSIKSNHLKTSTDSADDHQTKKTKTSYCSSSSSPWTSWTSSTRLNSIDLMAAFAQQLGSYVSTEHPILEPQEPQASTSSRWRWAELFTTIIRWW